MPILDALQYVGETLDKPWAAGRGLLAGRPDQLLNLVPFSDALGLTNPNERVSGRGMLESWGVLGQNKPGLDLGDVAGFGVELMDPVNLLGVGILGKAAKGARAARAANEGIASQNALIDSANAASQAMRQAGALPEEMLPNAAKFYDYIDDTRKAAFTKGDTAQLPGRLGSEGSAGRPVNLSELEGIIPKNSTDAFWPELIPRTSSDFADLRNDIAEITEEAGGGRFSSQGGHPASVGAGVDYLASLLQNPSTRGGIRNPSVYQGVIDDFRRRLRFADEENLKLIDSEIGEIAGRNLSSDFATHPQDVYMEILRDTSHPLSNRLRATEEFREIGQGLAGDFGRALAPAAEAVQSFYALPNPKFIDMDLGAALTSDNFPATLLESLEKSVDSMMFGGGSDYFQKNMEGVRRFLGDELADRLESQVTSGRRIPGIYEDPFSEGQTFLPYVAPALREPAPFQDVPQVPKSLFAALLGHNALARGAQ